MANVVEDVDLVGLGDPAIEIGQGGPLEPVKLDHPGIVERAQGVL